MRRMSAGAAAGRPAPGPATPGAATRSRPGWNRPRASWATTAGWTWPPRSPRARARNCSFTAAASRAARCCRMPMVATSASAWAARRSGPASFPRVRRGTGSTPDGPGRGAHRHRGHRPVAPIRGQRREPRPPLRPRGDVRDRLRRPSCGSTRRTGRGRCGSATPPAARCVHWRRPTRPAGRSGRRPQTGHGGSDR
jgi:hypothetical protein